MTQPPPPIQPSVNPGYANRYISDPLIGGGQISTNVLPTASAVAPGTNVYDSALGPMYSDGATYRQQGYLGLKKHPFLPAGVANVQAVMATPPTIAVSTVNPLAAGQAFGAGAFNAAAGATGVDLSNFGIGRAGGAVFAGVSAPDSGLAAFQCVSAGLTNGLPSYFGSNIVQVGVVHTGTVLVIGMKGLTGCQGYIKVNDQYVSLTPTATGTTGAVNYISVTFGGSATRRIDFIFDNVLATFRFAGIWVGQTDTLAPAQIRGPRVIVIGDSYTSATGAGGQALGYVGVMAEYLGWDDVWPSGVGGTGFITSGTVAPFGSRIANDVVPFAPDEVLFVGSVNDLTFPVAQLQAAYSGVIAQVQAALPTCRITLAGPTVLSGSGNQAGTATGVGYPAQRAAFQAAVAAANSPNVRYLDISSPGTVQTPQTFTLNALANAGATSLVCTGGGMIQGATWQFPDGSRCYGRSSAGATLTIDNLLNTQPAGTIITQVPNCYLRGNGFSGAPTGIGNADLMVGADHIHPTPLGHLTLGLLLGEAYAAQLNS